VFLIGTIAKEDEVTSTEETLASSFLKSESFSKELLFESAAKLLFLAIKWAKSVPSFVTLPVQDQKLLLEESWAELFVITAAQWGLSIDSGKHKLHLISIVYSFIE
jgi:nuclear receptor subfamily 2 group E member 3